MLCPRCNCEVGRKRRYCEQCGTDVYVTWHLIRRSNLFYNDGLARARVRDLSGAVISLKKSLEYDKYNTNARNLLGLVLFEMGETAQALSEWIISKHYCENDNLADAFLEKVHANPAKLDTINQSIKKYNMALAATQQGNIDLAVLQLRKVVSVRPGFLRAVLLLALLYLKTGEFEKARKLLVHAQKKDVANTKTLLYLAAAQEALGKGDKPMQEVPEDSTPDESMQFRIKPPTVDLSEGKPNYTAFLTFFLGILIGIGVLYALVVPTVRSDVKSEYLEAERDYNSELSAYTASITVLENEKTDLSEKLEKAEKNIEKLKTEIEDQEVFDAAAYEKVLLVIAKYPEVEAKVAAVKEDKDSLAVLDEAITYMNELLEVEETASERVKTSTVYHEVLGKITDLVKNQAYDYGKELYNGSKYREAATYLEAAYKAGRTDADCIYFTGRSYQRCKDNEKAVLYLNLVIEQYPGSDRAGMAENCLKDMNE